MARHLIIERNGITHKIPCSSVKPVPSDGYSISKRAKYFTAISVVGAEKGIEIHVNGVKIVFHCVHDFGIGEIKDCGVIYDQLLA